MFQFSKQFLFHQQSFTSLTKLSGVVWEDTLVSFSLMWKIRQNSANTSMEVICVLSVYVTPLICICQAKLYMFSLRRVLCEILKFSVVAGCHSTHQELGAHCSVWSDDMGGAALSERGRIHAVMWLSWSYCCRWACGDVMDRKLKRTELHQQQIVFLFQLNF